MESVEMTVVMPSLAARREASVDFPVPEVPHKRMVTLARPSCKAAAIRRSGTEAAAAVMGSWWWGGRDSRTRRSKSGRGRVTMDTPGRTQCSVAARLRCSDGGRAARCCKIRNTRAEALLAWRGLLPIACNIWCRVDWV